MLLPWGMPLRKSPPAPPLTADVLTLQYRLRAELLLALEPIPTEVLALKSQLYAALVLVALDRCQHDRRPRLRIREELISRALALACRLVARGGRDNLIERALDLAVRVARQ